MKKKENVKNESLREERRRRGDGALAEGRGGGAEPKESLICIPAPGKRGLVPARHLPLQGCQGGRSGFRVHVRTPQPLFQRYPVPVESSRNGGHTDTNTHKHKHTTDANTHRHTIFINLSKAVYSNGYENRPHASCVYVSVSECVCAGAADSARTHSQGETLKS